MSTARRRGAPAAAPARPDGQDDAVRLMDALRRVVRVLHVASRASERDLGVSAAQLFVLRQLAQTPGQSLSELAASTRTGQSSVSEVVARLVQRRLVERRTSPADRRRAELALTERGSDLLARAPETVQERLIAGFATLDQGQRRALAEGMEAWLASSGFAGTPATFFFEPTDDA